MAASLRLPLTWLTPPPTGRTDDLSPGPALARWAATVREAAEAVLVLDGAGRVVAVSPAATALLQLPERAGGELLCELLTVVDASASAVPDPDGAEQLPCLRVLRGQRPVARALVRLRRSPGPDGLLTLDAVGIAVEGGALAFFSEV